jgi:hypothetical protein
MAAVWITDCNTEMSQSALGYQTQTGAALHLNTAIAAPVARGESFARCAIAQPPPTGINDNPTPVFAR